MELTLSSQPGDERVGGPFQPSLAALDLALEGATEPPILIGHSMGALAGMLLAATYPDRLAGLVLTAPFVPVARNGRSSLATAADYARHRALFLAGSRSRRRRRQRSSALSVDFRTRASGLGALARFGLRPSAFHAIAARVGCPALIVHGSADHYVPPAFALAAAARHPAWHIQLIPGAGHFPHRDNGTPWLAVVEPFLQDLLPP